MSGKYHGLPDIDTAPDVFETADEPEIPLRPNNDALGEHDTPKKGSSEGLDATGLPDRRKAERAFGRVRRKDGSYQLGLPPLSRTLSSSSDDRPVRPKESAAARIRRLKAELAEVEKELAAGGSESASTSIEGQEYGTGAVGGQDSSKSTAGGVGGTGLAKRRSVLPPKEPMDVLGEVSRLQERLARLDTVSINGSGSGERDVWRDRLDSLGASRDTQNGYADEAGATANEPERPAASLTDLDQRLASLENVLGTSGEGIDQLPAPALLISVQKHEHLLTILTQPRHLDAIARRLKLLLVDLDRAAAASRRGHAPSSNPSSTPAAGESITLSASEYAQLSTLFTLLPRLDALLPIIPPLLARLSSLASLHADAADMADRLGRVEGEDKRNKEAEGDMRDVLEGVRKGLEEGKGVVLGNWEAVRARLDSMEERLGKL